MWLSPKVRGALISVVNSVPSLGRALKHSRELDFWKSRKKEEGQLGNAAYEYYYTTHFGIDREFYRDKRLLDIGCGPRGSLEWADMATERVGLDPLVPAYRKLGIDGHKMKYCAARSERIPFPDSYFDVVTSVNSLDHVDNVAETIREIARVTKPNGTFLLIVEVNHRIRACEPHNLPPDIIDAFQPAFVVTSSSLAGGETVRAKAPYPGSGPGFLSAILTRSSSLTSN
jgi:SAM-dependent methyltransferase